MFQEVGSNVFIITFTTRADKQRVEGVCLWFFDNYLFVINPSMV